MWITRADNSLQRRPAGFSAGEIANFSLVIISCRADEFLGVSQAAFDVYLEWRSRFQDVYSRATLLRGPVTGNIPS
jgi:hypothetical protein